MNGLVDYINNAGAARDGRHEAIDLWFFWCVFLSCILRTLWREDPHLALMTSMWQLCWQRLQPPMLPAGCMHPGAYAPARFA